MADSATWQVKYDGRDYAFVPKQDLTLVRLRQMKQWFGVELGRWAPFMNAFAQGDPDAIACVIWIVRNKAGETGVPEPRMMMDFSVGAFMEDFQFEAADPPTQAAQILGSTPTPTKSAAATSGSSPTSADSPPET
jgi:hypothetical protein